jgi:hypothetical protein
MQPYTLDRPGFATRWGQLTAYVPCRLLLGVRGLGGEGGGQLTAHGMSIGCRGGGGRDHP